MTTKDIPDSSSIMPLEEGNYGEYWNAAWELGATGWRGAEQSSTGAAPQPFVRNMYVFLASVQPEAAPGVAPLPYDARALGAEGNGIFSGPAEAAAVRSYIAGKCVLVPLCGDTPAIPFFASQGASMVVGADLSAQGLAAQMANNFPGVSFSATVVKDGASAADRVTLHEATVNGTVVRLFEGDFLRLPEVPAFADVKADFVYDRASFMAMNPALRAAYVRTVAGQLGPQTPLLVERPVRNEGDVSGPPFTFTNDVLKELYEKETKRGFDVDTILQFRWGDVRPTSPLWMEFISMRQK